jgi:3-methyl-2-oxobutanoate hydroxymethyltransferase
VIKSRVVPGRETERMARLTVKELQASRGTRRLTQVYVRDVVEAQACDEAGVEMIVATQWPSHDPGKLHAIRKAAPNTFITFGLPLYDVAGPVEIMRAAQQLMLAGADALYCPFGFDTVEMLANEMIPVVGHVGLIPYRSTWFGGMRAAGKTADEAHDLLDRCHRYAAAGAIGVEIEVVPHEVVAAIADRTDLLLIGMGAGTAAHVQYLFSTDVLGDNEGHVPRHAKVYRDFTAEYARLQAERVAAFRELRDDVVSGAYPGSGHQVAMPPDELDAFLEGLG